MRIKFILGIILISQDGNLIHLVAAGGFNLDPTFVGSLYILTYRQTTAVMFVDDDLLTLALQTKTYFPSTAITYDYSSYIQAYNYQEMIWHLPGAGSALLNPDPMLEVDILGYYHEVITINLIMQYFSEATL